VATFHMAPDYTKFHAFSAQTGISVEEEDNDPVCQYNIVSDDEDEKVETTQVSHPKARTIDFDLDGSTPPTPKQPAIVIEDEEDRQATTAAADFLRYHQKFGHISPKKIQVMARRGILPRRLASCPIPVCTACMARLQDVHGDRGHPITNKTQILLPDQENVCLSTSCLSSPTPGLIAQMTGYRTKQRYTTATVYVDQATGLGYVHLQKSTSAEETVDSKKAFEALAKSHGVFILQYNADNGIFKANLWLETCKALNQTTTCAGVGAHHQNGVAERRIRELQDMARTMLIHAQRRWPTAITANLWPYAIRMANDSINMTPNLKAEDHRTPLESFSSTTITTNPKHWHHFGCPVYVLSSNLQQAGGIHNKW
jgi:hypothetical protein